MTPTEGKKYKPRALKTPIKIDLRDYSLWLSGKNPFAFNEDTGEYEGHSSGKFIDGFIAALIKFKSGGADFTVDDFHSYINNNPVILLLDGFDEVADIKKRNEIIELVTKDSRRFKSMCSSFALIITSRPSAFINVQEFSKKYFDYWSLSKLNTLLVNEYSGKWIASKNIKPVQAREIRDVLRYKLSQAHTAELTRNTMQLAILLNLIYTKGNSLPDKITALYDGYVELFFDRESEKNSLVRDNRDILIDLHRYLGWHLHCLAETTNSNGSLSKDEIIETLSIYLEKEERDPKIAVTLFDGMIERVVFLVSRIVGRYEFEVQPLREYFAARHIYETAPSSSIGSECTDSKPDRLDALLRNNHWSNVTRFYVGCYSKGELSSILESIKNLIDDSNYTLTSIPYKITASFLSDWVFSQSRRSTSEAIRIVLSALGRQHMLTAGNGMRGGEVVRLPDGCGRKELVDECFRILSIEVHYDYLTEIAEILTSNATFEELKTTLEEKITASESSEAVMKWVRISSMLPVTYSLSNTSIEHCLRMTKYSPKCISILYNNNADLKIDNDENLKRIIMGLILDGDLTSPFMRNPLNEYKILSWLLSPRLYSTVFYGNSHARKLDQMFDRYGYFTKGRFEEEFEKLTGLGSSIMILVSKIRNLQGASIDEWKSSLKYCSVGVKTQ